MSWQAVPLEATTLIASPFDSVRQAVRRVDIWQRAAAAVGYQLEVAAAERFWRGGEAAWAGPVGPPGHRRRRITVELDDSGLPRFTVTAGWAKGAELAVQLADTGAGVSVSMTLGNPAPSGGPIGRAAAAWQARHRRRLVWALRMLIGMVDLEQHQTRVVVAAAIVRDGTVLAARRTYPAAAAGRWEFPGGKVALDEADHEALVRELAEELGVHATIGERLGPEVSLDVELVLRLYQAEIGAATPDPREHDEIRWLAADELDSVNWLAADRRLLPAVVRAVTERAPAGG